MARCLELLGKAELGLSWAEYLQKMMVGAAVICIRADDDLPQGTVGKIVEITADGAERRVEFPQLGTWSFPATDLRLAI